MALPHRGMREQYVNTNKINHMSVPGPEPMVRPVRCWTDHFLLDACPLLFNAWDQHLQQNSSLERKCSFQCFICFVLLKVLITTGS